MTRKQELELMEIGLAYLLEELQKEKRITVGNNPVDMEIQTGVKQPIGKKMGQKWSAAQRKKFLETAKRKRLEKEKLQQAQG
jgi:hypothetical protein